MQVSESVEMQLEKTEWTRKEELLVCAHLVAVGATACFTAADMGIISFGPAANTIVAFAVFLTAASVVVIPSVFCLVLFKSKRSAKERWMLLTVEAIVFVVHLAWLFPSVS